MAEFNTYSPGISGPVVVYMVSVPVEGTAKVAPTPFKLELTVQLKPDPPVISSGTAIFPATS